MSQLLSKVTVTCILQFLHQMFNVLDDTLKPATPLTNGAISETLRHTLDISQGNVATHIRSGKISLVIVLYYKFSPDYDSEIILKIG